MRGTGAGEVRGAAAGQGQQAERTGAQPGIGGARRRRGCSCRRLPVLERITWPAPVISTARVRLASAAVSACARGERGQGTIQEFFDTRHSNIDCAVRAITAAKCRCTLSDIRTRQASNPLTQLSCNRRRGSAPVRGRARRPARHQRPRRAAGAGAAAAGLRADGDLAQLRLPQAVPGVAPHEPTEGLWRHTCMELFVSHGAAGRLPRVQPGAVRPVGGVPVFRVPCGHGTAHRHPAAAHRAADPGRPAAAERGRGAAGAAATPPACAWGSRPSWRTPRGRLSYWALSHGGERPDFHHADSFGFEI